jgi:acyl CoA:acetate/3-ketoacid CoA transferase beta subunit
MTPEEIIVRRAIKELSGKHRIGLSPGMPQMLIPCLAADACVYQLTDLSETPPRLDAIVLEAAEVTEDGFAAPAFGSASASAEADRWIALMLQTDSSGHPRIVRQRRYPAAGSVRVQLVITEQAVVEVTDQGLVLREIRPGVATDTVKKETRASLHVADDIKLMEL